MNYFLRKNMEVNSVNQNTVDVQNDVKDSLTKIAKELSTEDKVRTPNAIYQSVKRLRDKGYLIEIEDRLIKLNLL